MRRFFVGIGLACVICMSSMSAGAGATAVPHFLNYQSLLYDDGGNLLADGPANVTFKVKDAGGHVLFEETQTLDVVRGAVSALVGNGLTAAGAPTGGVPLSVMEPGGERYLEVAVEGYPPEGQMEIVSVPYAVYAELALGAADEAIDGAAIAKKAITMEHLSDSFVNDLATQMSAAGAIATRTDLTNMQTTYRGVGGASNIGVTAGFVYSGSNNLQDVLRDLDRAIQHRQGSVEIIETNITNEISARTASDTTLQNNINNEASARAAADAAETTARRNKDNEHDSRLDDLGGRGNSYVQYSGVVNCSDPPTIQGEHVTVSEPAMHVYRIIFNDPLPYSNYAVSLTLERAAPAYDVTGPIMVVSNKTMSSFDVSGFPAIGNLSTISFGFAVIGPE